MTSWPSLKLDLENAGASWVDEEVVGDGNLVTSRKPADIPAFTRATIALFERGRHEAPDSGQELPSAPKEGDVTE